MAAEDRQSTAGQRQEELRERMRVQPSQWQSRERRGAVEKRMRSDRPLHHSAHSHDAQCQMFAKRGKQSRSDGGKEFEEFLQRSFA